VEPGFAPVGDEPVFVPLGSEIYNDAEKVAPKRTALLRRHPP
jgi:hypothetical protein